MPMQCRLRFSRQSVADAAAAAAASALDAASQAARRWTTSARSKPRTPPSFDEDTWSFVISYATSIWTASRWPTRPMRPRRDADFNVMAEPEEAYQEDFVEDLRYNRASRIPSGRFRDLLDEICSDLFDSQLSAGRASPAAGRRVLPAHPLSQDDQEEATAEPECLLQPCARGRPQPGAASGAEKAAPQCTCSCYAPCASPAISSRLSWRDSAKVHLNELKLLADAYEAANRRVLRSCACHLDGAVSLADNFAGLSDTDLLVCYSRPVAPELPLFPPGMSASVCRSKRTVFTPSEDRLLAARPHSVRSSKRRVPQLISKYTMPWRSQVAISARCVYLSKLQSLLFRDSLCPARVLTSGASPRPQAHRRPDSKQSEPDSIDLNFCQSNWINSVPILTDCVLDRPADWCHLPQLFRQHLLLERPRLRGQLLKPTEPNPLERDTANDQANKLFKRCRILYATRKRLLGVRLLWRDPQMAAVVPASLNPPPQSLQRRRRGPKRRRVSRPPYDHSAGPAGQRSPAARPLADSTADATDFRPLSGSQQPPAHSCPPRPS
uniref:NTP_transf_2 domain-containing protein n=1 Tax=Macrostomum lignano TaxID=282301 RepID=A0A1I8FIH5_9PLAT